jgi:hypothetical protein
VLVDEGGDHFIASARAELRIRVQVAACRIEQTVVEIAEQRMKRGSCANFKSHERSP